MEGIFAHYEDSPLGRVARFEVEIGEDRGESGGEGVPGEGLVAIYKDGPQFEVVAFDSTGRARPDWAAAFRQRPLQARPVSASSESQEWTAMVRRLGAQLEPTRRPHAIAAIVVRPI